MIRIGDFARLGGVSVETLRHYDELGLLTPGRVGESTGYRYYHGSQLVQLNRILALKDLGFSLRQIEDVLGRMTRFELVRLLEDSRVRAEQALAEDRARLKRISARLRHIELEEDMPDYDLVMKEVPAMLVASRRVTIPTNDQVPEYLGPAFDEAYGLVRRGGAKEAGPCLALWHQPAVVLQDEDAEAAVPIDRLLAGTDRVRVYELPRTSVISVVHQGSFDGMTQAHVALVSWMEENGYQLAGAYREVYVQSAKNSPKDQVTEIQYPITRTG